MAITILDTILDEEIRTPTGTADEHDVASLSAGVQAAIEAVTDPGDFIASPTGFPQFAEKTNFVSSDNPVTDYFLGDSAGDPLDGVATDLYVGSNQIFLYSLGENIVVGRVGSGTTADPAGEIALVIALQETVDSGFVTSADLWLALFAPLVQDGEDLVDSADQLDLTDLIYLGSDFDTTTEVPFTDFSDVPSGNPDFNVIFPTGVTADVQLLVTGSEGGEQSTVNISTQGIGAGAQHVENGASLRIDTVSGMVQANVDDNSELVPGAIDYAGHVNIVAGEFEITQVNPGNPNARADLTLFVFQVDDDEPQEQAYLDDANSDDGAPVQIDVADVRIFLGAVDVTATFGGTITQNGDGVTITGLDDDHIVKFTTDGVEFDRILITNVDSKETFDIGNIKVTALQGGSDTEFEELGSHLIFQDDGPVITASGATAPSMLVDESDFTADDTDDYSGLFDPPDYGADGEGSLGYTLGVSAAGADSGLIDTATNHSVFLFLVSGVVVGLEGTDAADAEANGDEVFRVSVDSDGNVTLDQSRAVMHDDETDPNDTTGLLSAGLITLTATAYDSEAADENDSDSATVDIGDTFLFMDDGPSIDESSGEDLLVTNGETPGDSASGDFDLDPENDQNANVTIVGAPDSDGFTFSFDDADNDSITGQFNGDDLYTLVVDDNGGYLFTLIGELPSSTLNLSTAEIKAGGPDTNSIEVGAVENDNFVRISGDSTVGAGNINESHAFVGVDNGNLDANESLVFSLHEADGDPLYFQGISIGTKSAQSSMYHWEAALVGGGTASGNLTVGKNGTLLIDPAGDVLIDTVTITKLSGSATKIGLGDIDILLPPGDFQLGFDVQLTDGDDDFVGASFIVEIDGDADGLITSPFIV